MTHRLTHQTQQCRFVVCSHDTPLDTPNPPPQTFIFHPSTQRAAHIKLQTRGMANVFFQPPRHTGSLNLVAMESKNVQAVWGFRKGERACQQGLGGGGWIWYVCT